MNMKMTNDQAEAARWLRENRNMTYTQLGTLFGVSGETVRRRLNPEIAEKYKLATKRPIDKRREKAKKNTDQVRQVTLAEIAKRAQAGAKTVEGTIHNATIEDLALINDMFNVTFTIHFQ